MTEKDFFTEEMRVMLDDFLNDEQGLRNDGLFSVLLTKPQQAKLDRVEKILGSNTLELIRRALEEACDQVLGDPRAQPKPAKKSAGKKAASRKSSRAPARSAPRAPLPVLLPAGKKPRC